MKASAGSFRLATGLVCAILFVSPLRMLAGGDKSSLKHKTKAALKTALLDQPTAVVPAGHWAPIDVDAEVPGVAPGVPCPLQDVLSSTSKRVEELVTNLQQFTATERLRHIEIDGKGKAHGKQTRSFAYVVAINEPRLGILNVEEYRNGDSSLEVFPANLATTGLPAFALIFHPYLLGDFQMSCEGLGTWRGQPAWQIHFRQRVDKISRIRSYRVRGTLFPVNLKGRAWIAADSFQVVRLETDLTAPIRAIPLELEHLVIEYEPVQFQKRHAQLWLPESAELFLYYRRHRYHRWHTFSNFQLFSVDVHERIQEPREPEP